MRAESLTVATTAQLIGMLSTTLRPALTGAGLKRRLIGHAVRLVR
jgi:hypothetical protein